MAATDVEPDGLASLLAEWLRFYPPVAPERVVRTLGLDPLELDETLAELADAQVVVLDELTEGAASVEVCDRVNLERLLRMARAEARPQLQPLPARALPLLLAGHQGLGLADAVPDDLQQTLERLFGLPLPAEVWETEVLPARLDPYVPLWLDALLAESDLRWVGCGRRRLLFALDEERGLFPCSAEPEAPGGTAADKLFPHPLGRFHLDELVRSSGLVSGELTDRLWAAAWRGEVSSDSFAPLRQATATGFRHAGGRIASPAPEIPRRASRSGFDRWRRERPFAGAWFALPPAPEAEDPLAADEVSRERARIVLDRYGLVFRALLERELPELRWGRLFRALRLLELGGEVVAGHFVDGVDGLQFASHAVVRRLREGLDESRAWWLSAVDPASPCGIALDLHDWPLPRRAHGNHLAFLGTTLGLVSVRRGAVLTFLVAPDHPRLPELLAPLENLVARAVAPLPRIDVEEINGEPAAASPYRNVLVRRFRVDRQPTCLRLTRKY